MPRLLDPQSSIVRYLAGNVRSVRGSWATGAPLQVYRRQPVVCRSITIGVRFCLRRRHAEVT